MVTIVEDVNGATINIIEGIDGSRGGVFMETSVLDTREVRLMIIESGLTTSIKDLELITSYKPEVAEDEDVTRIKTGSLVDSSWSPVCSVVGVVEGATVPRRSPSNRQWKRVDVE